MKNFISLLLAAIMLVASLSGCAATNTGKSSPIDSKTQALLDVIRVEPYAGTNHTYTLEDNFTEEHVIVVLTKEASLSFKEYGIQDFPEIACAKVDDLALSSTETAKEAAEKLWNALDEGKISKESLANYSYSKTLGQYYMVLIITLSKPGKQQVLDAIKLLEARDDVLCATPNMIATLE